LEVVEYLDRNGYRVEGMLTETYDDLDQALEFLRELQKFQPEHDDKLAALIKLLKSDPVMSKHKVLLFTEYADTAHYWRDELRENKMTDVDEADSGTKRSRIDMIRSFAPYYNGTSSQDLAAKGMDEIRVLMSTDVLSEGLSY